MERLTSGPNDHYYGKADVTVYRLIRDGSVRPGSGAVFGANVKMLTWGGAFWPTYLRGDNTGLIATDSMKNFIQRHTFEFTDFGLENYCRFIGRKFLDTYPQVEGLQMTAVQLPYAGLEGGVAFIPAGPDQAFARIEMTQERVVSAVSGIQGFKLLRLRGSSFQGFVRDQHTTLPDRPSRVLHMWLDMEWSYANLDAAFSDGAVTARVRAIVMDVFKSFESASIQQIIHKMGTRIFADIPEIAELRFEASNRTWDVVQERGEEFGVYIDPAAPYGVLGLTLTR
ncbi:MAG TPA: urate oxidase [Vicinamibacterales bacterium]|nr:urate oxidase [Vicinamibacterales bacterium]